MSGGDCRSLGSGRDDKGRGMAQVGVVSGMARNSRSVRFAFRTVGYGEPPPKVPVLPYNLSSSKR
jgi:hypothetical protein